MIQVYICPDISVVDAGLANPCHYLCFLDGLLLSFLLCCVTVLVISFFFLSLFGLSFFIG